MELRKKALELIVDLVTTRTVDDLVGFLKKEINKSSHDASLSTSGNNDSEPDGGSGSNSTKTEKGNDTDVYRHALVHAIRKICMRFPASIPAILPTLCEVSNSCIKIFKIFHWLPIM